MNSLHLFCCLATLVKFVSAPIVVPREFGIQDLLLAILSPVMAVINWSFRFLLPCLFSSSSLVAPSTFLNDGALAIALLGVLRLGRFTNLNIGNIMGFRSGVVLQEREGVGEGHEHLLHKLFSK